MTDDIERAMAQAWATGEAFFEVGPDGIRGVVEEGREWAEKLASVTDTRGATVTPGRLARILAVLRRGHRYVEDTWYSCPQEPSEGCANDADGTACNCGYYERHMAADLLERAYGLGVDNTTE